MKKLSKLLYEPLVWKSDGLFKTSFTLYHEDEPLAHYRLNGGVFSSAISIYLAEAEEPLFVFRPEGLFYTRLEVTSDDPEFVPAKIKPLRWGGGVTITFVDGSQYEWRAANFLSHRWGLRSVGGLEIATQELSTWGTHGTITIESNVPSEAELNLLIFAGWTQYLLESQAALVV